MTTLPPEQPDGMPRRIRVEPASLPGAGQRLGPMRLLEEIGRGAMGVVYRAQHGILGREVAVKVLLHVAYGPGEAGYAMFLEEARSSVAVRHANLVQVHHADLVGATPYLVMDYIAGPSLKQLLGRCGALPLAMALCVLEDIAPAIDQLHRNGVVHRDLKPSNILLSGEGQAYVSDFGLAFRRPVAAGVSEADAAGTPDYMAPEVFMGQVSARSDMYALGVMTYEMLTGRLPFTGNLAELAEQHRSAAVPPQPLLERGLGEGMVDVIERAMHKQAVFRYKTPMDFLRALKEAAGTAGPSPRTRDELVELIVGERGKPGPAQATEAASPASYRTLLSQLAVSKRQQRSQQAPGTPEPDGSSALISAAKERFGAAQAKPLESSPPRSGTGGSSRWRGLLAGLMARLRGRGGAG